MNPKSPFVIASILLLVSACRPTIQPLLECTLEVSETVVTVATLSWEGEWLDVDIRYGSQENLELQTEAMGNTAVLTGNAAGAPLFYEVNTADGATCNGSVELELPPEVIPTVQVDVFEPSLTDSHRYFMFGAFDYGGRGDLLIVNRSGEVVWYLEGAPSQMLLDFQPKQDGNGFIFNRFDATFAEDIGVLILVDIHGNRHEEVGRRWHTICLPNCQTVRWPT